MQKTEWFKRSFPPIEDNGLLPAIIERLAGTPARVEEITRGLSPEQLVLKPGNKWSVKVQIGHLTDLEPLWLGRLEDLAAGLAELRVTDLTNQKTHNANHNATELKTLQQLFRKQREAFVTRLLSVTDEELSKSALHPRLKTQMRIIDLAWFVAEHDDHHLASVRALI
jgi:uncharacterized damage-inducible protein DinB